jgi:hypothetical protein
VIQTDGLNLRQHQEDAAAHTLQISVVDDVSSFSLVLGKLCFTDYVTA